jgi:hypothetical protein
MTDDNGPYTPEQHKGAVRAYLVTGTYRAAAKLCGVPAQTICYWKLHGGWWADVELRVSMELEEKTRAELRRILKISLEVLEDRLKHGNHAVHRGIPIYEQEVVDGTLVYKLDAEGKRISVRVPITAKDAILIMGIAFDKLRLMDGRPSRIVAREDDVDRMAQLRAAALAAKSRSEH